MPVFPNKCQDGITAYDYATVGVLVVGWEVKWQLIIRSRHSNRCCTKDNKIRCDPIISLKYVTFSGCCLMHQPMHNLSLTFILVIGKR